MPTVDDTIAFIKSEEGHGLERLDKGGSPYFEHPIAVMKRLPTGVADEVKHAALLHDMIEDEGWTLDELKARGYSDKTLDMVELVSTDLKPQATYMEKIQALIATGNEGAILVKWADMAENSDLQRLAKVPEEKREKLRKKYKMPFVILTEAVKKFGYDVSAGVPSRQ